MVESPDPEVYRAAARSIMRGTTNFSCTAICRVCTRRKLNHEEYKRQYRLACTGRGGALPRWWNGWFTEKNRSMRVKALRDMADLCEGKEVPQPLGRRT